MALLYGLLACACLAYADTAAVSIDRKAGTPPAMFTITPTGVPFKDYLDGNVTIVCVSGGR